MFEVRTFRNDDKETLADIYLKCRLDTFHWVPKNEFKLNDFENDTDGEKILVLTADSIPVGFISIWMQDHFIHHLFVDPSHQGRWHGLVLLTEGLKIIGRPARLKCVIRNLRAFEFYEKHGWKIESTTHDGPMGAYRTYALTI